MSAQDALDLINLVSGKSVPPAKAAKYARMLVDKHGRGQNPWSPVDNPDEYNAWPTNDEMGALFIKRVRQILLADIKVQRATEYDQGKAAALKEVDDDL